MQIDVSKLEVGQIYSYKQLCELTGAEYKKGRSRTLQLQNYSENGFKRFFDFEKVAYGKYKIIDIYKTPLNVCNNKNAGNASVYLLYIELIMLRYLANEYGKEVIFSRKRLWKLLGMINEKYGVIENEKLQKLDKSITQFEIDNFYFRANHKLDRILKVALKNLSDRSLIDASPVIMICKNINGHEKHVVANDNEIATILSVNRRVLDEFNCETLSQVILKKKQKDYFRIVNYVLYENYGWKYYYKAYKIIFNYNDIKRFIPRLETNLMDAVSKLNSEIINSLNSEAEKLYNNKLEKYNNEINNAKTDAEFFEATKNWHYPINYVIAQRILANELIAVQGNEDDSCKDILYNIKSNVDEELDELF